MKTTTLKDYEEFVQETESKYTELLELYDALSSFLTDYETLKNKYGLTQKAIATSMGTTQSAISRIESLKTNPSYKQLLKMSKAVNGNLYITPMGDMTATVHYDLQALVRTCAANANMSTAEWVDEKLNDAVRKEKSNLAFTMYETSIEIDDDCNVSPNIHNTDKFEMTCHVSEASPKYIIKDKKNLAG